MTTGPLITACGGPVGGAGEGENPGVAKLLVGANPWVGGPLG